MEHRSIQEYVDEYVEVGEGRFARLHPHPILLQRDAPATDEDAKFETAYLPRTILEDDEDEAAEGQTVPPGASTDRRPRRGQVFLITKREGAPFGERVGIGRARNADVHLPLAKVSKYHAFITRSEDGAWSITDAGSRNGTMVDERRLEARVPHPLSDGCQVQVGPYRFVFFTATGFVETVGRRAALQT